jgi:hypothetical protein
LVWIPIASGIGFAMTSLLAGWLELSRPWFVLIYAPAVLALSAAYVRRSNIDVGNILARHWQAGLLAGAAFGAFLVFTVQRQDASARPDGWQLAWDLTWLGVVYGAADAILLSILPGLATWRAFRQRGWTSRWTGKVGVGMLVIMASLIVTGAYHAGFPEFQGIDMRQPMIGNSVVTLAYVLTNNPIAAVIGHVAMHVAAVLHGAGTTTQLPPHY